MPFRQVPTSAAGIARALDDARQKYAATASADRLFTQDQFDRYLDLTAPTAPATGSVLFRLNKKIGEALGALIAQVPLTNALDITRGLLRLSISHFIQNVNNAINRGDLPRETRTTFKLALDSDHVPDLDADADLLLWSQRIIDGEATRAAAGGPALAWPSAAQIATRRTTFIDQSDDQSEAKDRTDHEQGDVAALLPEALTALKDLWDTIEFNLRHEPSNPSRRRRAREWGVYYASRPGETPDPVPPAPPTPPTP